MIELADSPMEWLVDHSPWIDGTLNLLQVVGIPVAIGVYFFAKKRERRDREYGTFDALDDKYVEYQLLCLDNLDLDVADREDRRRGGAGQLTPDQEKRERVLFTVLFSMLERSFLMYKGHRSAVRRRQWTGWESYIESWCGRDNFATFAREQIAEDEFDKQFLRWLRATFLPT